MWSTQPATGQSAPEAERHPVDADGLTASCRLTRSKYSLSKFVDFINQHLAAISRRDAVGIAGRQDRRDIAQLTTPEDSDYALSLAQALQQRQLDALLPVFDVRMPKSKASTAQLAQCDAVILCWPPSEARVRAQRAIITGRNWAASSSFPSGRGRRAATG
jgi:hypothetical protein